MGAEVYNLEAFGDAMSVALAHAAFLPAAACFALLPLVSLGAKTGNEAAGAVLDYDLSRERVTLTAARDVGCVAPARRNCQVWLVRMITGSQSMISNRLPVFSKAWLLNGNYVLGPRVKCTQVSSHDK